MLKPKCKTVYIDIAVPDALWTLDCKISVPEKRPIIRRFQFSLFRLLSNIYSSHVQAIFKKNSGLHDSKRKSSHHFSGRFITLLIFFILQCSIAYQNHLNCA